MANEAETALWDRLQARDYAEEGIPVILAVETVGISAPVPGQDALARDFLATAGRLGTRLEVTPAEVTPAKVIELLAARDLDLLSPP